MLHAVQILPDEVLITTQPNPTPMTNETNFPQGIFAKQPHPNAPDFVKASISLKRAEAIQWLQNQPGEWVNLDIKEGRSGKWYAAVNQFEPKQGAPQQPKPEPLTETKDGLPF